MAKRGPAKTKLPATLYRLLVAWHSKFGTLAAFWNLATSRWVKRALIVGTCAALIGTCAALIGTGAPASAQDGVVVMTGDAATLYRQGVSQLHANDNVNAVTSLARAVTLAPNVSEIHHTLGLALAKTGQVGQAILELETARNLNPNSAASWMTLAGLYQTQGRISQAIATFKEFLRRFPNDREAGKVATLVQGLEKEKLIESPSSPDDYLMEVTRDGLFRWSKEKMPLKVYIGPGNTIVGYKPQFLDILKKSFSDWSQVSNGMVSFVFVDDPINNDIECTWSGDPGSFRNVAEAGETRLTTSSKRGLIKGTIKFLTVPFVRELPVTDARIRTTCLHEIGHVLGMGGHTTNPEDCMFYSVVASADAWKDLSARDANTLIKLYSLPAVAPQSTTSNPSYNAAPQFVR